MGGGVFPEPGPSAPFLHPQSALLAQNGTGSLPRNLAATLQDIETKRQLALQQKGEWLLSWGPGYLPRAPYTTLATVFLCFNGVVAKRRKRLD